MQGPKLITLLYFNNILNYNNPLTREVSKLKKKKKDTIAFLLLIISILTQVSSCWIWVGMLVPFQSMKHRISTDQC